MAEEAQGRARGLLIAVADQIPASTASLVDELISANECATALEILSDMLVESGAVVDRLFLRGFEREAGQWDLDEVFVVQLRSLLVESPSDDGPDL